MKKVLFLLLLFCFTTTVNADEGMWLPSLLKDGRINDMQAKGLKLTAEDLYSINQASLKDAIVRFGRGCTGELISEKGLLLTNHHCGYDQVQAHSSVENDYLRYGFTAMNHSQELPNPGLVVSFLEEMTDVTNLVLKGVKHNMTEEKRQEIINTNINKIVEKATKGKNLTASVESLYYGNQFFLFVYKVYKDVRLVFAPASSVGSFGGSDDNWMWPRHSGDFSLFRIYADENNEPAEYSPNNVPFKPKKTFKISVKGVDEGDFCFIYGFPGRTMEYLHSEAVRFIEEKANPLRISLRTIRLDIMNREQNRDPEIRIKYAVKNSRIANAWKKWQGELQGIIKLETVKNKQTLENRFIEWSKNNPEYQGVVERLNRLYSELEPYALADEYYKEAAYAPEILNIAYNFISLDPTYEGESKQVIDNYFKDYELVIDREITHKILRELKENLDPKFLPEIFVEADLDEFLENMFESSIFTNKESLLKAFEDDNFIELITNDPAFKLSTAFRNKKSQDITPKVVSLNQEIELEYRNYMRGLMIMNSDQQFYPDANSTLRVAYGKIEGFTPRDGVYYKAFSTIDGVVSKFNPDNYDYNVPEKLLEAYKAKDFGRWEVDGTVPVCVLASNHTTGGNSGSPLLDSEGNLIAINFDRCWESTMSDIQFDPDMCRNISVDIRYVLFLIDKVGGASYLIDEMNIVY